MPIRSVGGAKTRLIGATPTPDSHDRLVRAIRQDTLRAAAAASGVARLVAVTDITLDDDGVGFDAVGAVEVGLEHFVQSSAGLNAALTEAAAWAAGNWPTDGVVALVGDLPALRPEDLADVLAQAARHSRGFVPDAAGTGTTLLSARPGTALAPAFGPDSAARHAAGASRLDARPGLRLDVDTAADLRAATELGVGASTGRVLAADGEQAPAASSGQTDGVRNPPMQPELA